MPYHSNREISADCIKDIVAALLDLHRAFAKHDLPRPDVLGYEDLDQAWDAVRKLWYEVQRDDFHRHELTLGASDLQIVGVKIRYCGPKREAPPS